MHLRHNDTELSSPGSGGATVQSVVDHNTQSGLLPPGGQRDSQRLSETLQIFSSEQTDGLVGWWAGN